MSIFSRAAENGPAFCEKFVCAQQTSTQRSAGPLSRRYYFGVPFVLPEWRAVPEPGTSVKSMSHPPLTVLREDRAGGGGGGGGGGVGGGGGRVWVAAVAGVGGGVLVGLAAVAAVATRKPVRGPAAW